MKRRLFSGFAVILLILLSYPSCTHAQDLAKSAKEAVNNYIQGYLKDDFKNIVISDLRMFKHLRSKVENVPKPFQEEEAEKEGAKALEKLKNKEQNKLTNGTSLIDIRTMNIGMNLFNILYPKMKYEILEVRDFAQGTIVTNCSNCSGSAFVRLFYFSPEYAPFLDPSKASKVKSVIAEIYYAEFAVSQNGKNQENLFFLSHFSPTDYKRELFKVGSKENEKIEIHPALKKESNAQSNKTEPKTSQPPNSSDKSLVINIQQELKALGYYNMKIDGIAGRGTFNAIKSYQQDNKLMPDGKPSKELLAHMETRKKISNEPKTFQATVEEAVDGFIKTIFKKK